MITIGFPREITVYKSIIQGRIIYLFSIIFAAFANEESMQCYSTYRVFDTPPPEQIIWLKKQKKVNAKGRIDGKCVIYGLIRF